MINADKEPITPLVARIRALANRGVSCVLVIGGSGDYFEVADHVIAMDSFKAVEMTQQAHEIAAQFGANYAQQSHVKFGEATPRSPISISSGKGCFQNLCTTHYLKSSPHLGIGGVAFVILRDIQVV